MWPSGNTVTSWSNVVPPTSIGWPSVVTSRAPARPRRAPTLAAGFGPERPDGADEADDHAGERAAEQDEQQLAATEDLDRRLDLLVQLLLGGRGDPQRLALLDDVVVEVEVLGPAHEPEPDADERRGQPEAEQVAGVVGAVADGGDDPAGDGDDERDHRRPVGPLVDRARRSRHDLVGGVVGVERRVPALVGGADPAGEGDQREQGEQPGGEALGDRTGAAEVVDGGGVLGSQRPRCSGPRC